MNAEGNPLVKKYDDGPIYERLHYMAERFEGLSKLVTALTNENLELNKKFEELLKRSDDLTDIRERVKKFTLMNE